MKYRAIQKGKTDLGKVTLSTVIFRHPKTNGQLDVPDMKKILSIVENGLPENSNVMIRGLTGHRFWTFKTFKQDLKVLEFDEYYKSKVSDTSKFSKFEYIEVTVQKQKY